MGLAISLWFHQQARVFAGIAVILLALVSFPVANFGGLLIGLTFRPDRRIPGLCLDSSDGRRVAAGGEPHVNDHPRR